MYFDSELRCVYYRPKSIDSLCNKCSIKNLRMNSLALEETKTLPGNEYLPLFYMTLVLYVDNIYIVECFHM